VCGGLLWIECKQVYINGAREHFLQYYNYMDFAILALYMASYSLRLATYYRVSEASIYFNATAKIHRAVADCDPQQMNQLIREIADRSDDQHGYFMAACTSLYAPVTVDLLGLHTVAYIKRPQVEVVLYFTDFECEHNRK